MCHSAAAMLERIPRGAGTRALCRPATVPAARGCSRMPRTAARRVAAQESQAAQHHHAPVLADAPPGLPLILAAALGAWCPDAQAALTYNPASGEEMIKTVSGAAYVALVAFFAWRVLGRRAKRAREERLRDVRDVSVEPLPSPEVSGDITALAVFINSIQAAALAAGLAFFSTKVHGALEGTSVPDGYTAQRITVTVRTLIVGLSYLATFTFAANAVGLFGLALQMALFPGSLRETNSAGDADAAPRGPQLPDIKVTSQPGEVRRAFDLARKADGKD